MPAMQSLSISSSVASWMQKRSPFVGRGMDVSKRLLQYAFRNINSCIPSQSFALLRSSSAAFHRKTMLLRAPRRIQMAGSSPPSKPVVMMARPVIQFIQGTDEQTIPDIKLTKSRDGTNGVATFIFDEPSVFDSSSELGDITGFYMIDEEGVIQSTNVSAKFVNGKPSKIEAKHIMRSPREWDRFMRFMERYSNANGLQFIKN